MDQSQLEILLLPVELVEHLVCMLRHQLLVEQQMVQMELMVFFMTFLSVEVLAEVVLHLFLQTQAEGEMLETMEQEVAEAGQP